MTEAPTAPTQVLTFAEVLEAAERLGLDAQAELVTVLAHRLRQTRREKFLEGIEEAEREYEAGECRAMTVEEIMRETAP